LLNLVPQLSKGSGDPLIAKIYAERSFPSVFHCDVSSTVMCPFSTSMLTQVKDKTDEKCHITHILPIVRPHSNLNKLKIENKNNIEHPREH